MTRRTTTAWLTRGLGLAGLALSGCGWGTPADTDGSGDGQAVDWSFLDEEGDTDEAMAEVGPPTPERLDPRMAMPGDPGAAPNALVFHLAQDFFKRDQKGTLPEGTVLEVGPGVAGVAEVTGPRTLRFVPEDGFAPGKTITASLRSVSNGEHTLQAPADGSWERTFETPELGFLYAVPTSIDVRRQKVDLALVFSGPVDAASVRKVARFSHARGTLLGQGYRLADGQPNRVLVTLTGGSMAAKGDISTTIRDGFTGLGNAQGKGGEHAWSWDPTRPPVNIESIHLVEGTNRFSVEVICDDEASEGYKRWVWLDHVGDSFRVSPRCMPTEASAENFIEVSPPVPYNVVPTRGGFRITGALERGGVRVSLRPGLETVDGGRLREGNDKDLVVPALEPTVGFTASGRYLPRDAWARLPVQHRNVDTLNVRIRHVPERNLMYWLTADSEKADERVSDLLVDENIPVRGDADARTTTWIDVKQLLPEARKGVYEVTVKGGGAHASARLLLTDLNLVAKAGELGSDQELHVWALGMEDGAAQSGVEVSAVRPSGKVLASCTTQATGCVLKLPNDDVDSEVPVALVARRGDDLTYLKFSELKTEVAEDIVQGEPYASERPYRASMYTERGVFRPGETAHLAGIVRDQEHLAPPKGMPVDIEVLDPRSKLIRTLSAKTNEAGMFTVDVPFADYARTGSYRVRARAGKKELGSVTFAVEEFVPERMEVEASIAGTDFLDTDTVEVGADARYLFGGSAADHRYEVGCKLVPTRFKPAKNTNYTYGEALEGYTARAIELGRVTGHLDEEGAGTLACPSLDHAAGFTGAARVVADVAVFEAGSGRTTNATATATVHGAKYYVGLRTGVETIEAGAPFTVEGVVVDWTGEPVSDVKQLELELQQLENEWGYVWDEERGTERWQRVLRSVPAGSELVEVKNGRFKVTMTSQDDAAKFRLIARADEARTALDVDGDQDWWWWDDGERHHDATPRPMAPTEVAMTVPEAIEVGASTKVGFTAPFKGRALLTVETDHVLRSEWMAVDAGPQEWSFTLGDFADNVYVSAMVVKDPHLESEQAFLPDRAFGVQSIEVRPTAFTGKLDLSVPETVRSDSTLKVDLDLGPGKGKRFVTVAAVDEGILSLTDFETPDPFDALFPTRALGVRTWETVGWSMHLQPPGPSSSTGGDGMGAGAGRVQMVKPVSLWSGLVEVPESGKVSVPFEVPRYRGKLRVMAVSSGKKELASAEAHVTVRDPVVLQTTLPRFMVQGDEVEIPVFLTNMSGKDRTVELALDAEAIAVAARDLTGSAIEPLLFEGAKKTTLRIPDGESATAVFRVRTQLRAGGVRLAVVAKSEDIEVSEELDVPVQPDGPRERVTHKVELSGTADLDPLLTGWVPGTERTSVWVTNNPYGEAFSHLGYVVRYPYGCLEQTTSSTRPLLFVGNLLEVTEPDLAADGKIEEMVQHGVDRLMNMQTPSGGFAYWMGGTEPNAWGTAYATHMLLDARKAGFAVPEENLGDAIDWLAEAVEADDDAHDRYHGGVSPGGAAYMHYVLARAGKGNTARMTELLKELGPAGDGAEKEAVYLLQAGLYLAGDRRYEKQLKDLDTSPLVRRRSNDWSFYSDQRRRGFQLAVYADLFDGDPGAEGDALARLVADNLSQPRSRYYTTQEITWGITGLGTFLGSGARDYEARLMVDGKPQKPDSWGAGGKGDAMTWSLTRASELGDVDLRVDKKGSGKLYAIVTSEGMREGATWDYGGRSLSVTREFLTQEGRTVNLADVSLGDVVYAKVTLRNTSGERVQNIALVDRFPAGWEIENPRLGRGGGADWVDTDALWDSDNMELRDDRLEMFGALGPGQEAEVVYVLRAVTAGTFALPPVEAEAMYDPTVWTRARGGTVTIHGPWEKFYL